MKRGLVASVCALGALVFGCQHDVQTSFPPGLEPLESDPAPAPAATPTDPYPETIDVQAGNDGKSDYVHATGYVHASIEDVWAAMKDPEVVVDRHHVDAWTSTPNVETGYDVSFRTDYTVNNLVTVQFSLTWREGVVEGTEAAPSGVSVVYEKTSGSSYINIMIGSIELTTVADGVTKLEYAQRMDAAQTDSSNISLWTNGMFASIVARVHGQPLP